MGLEGVLAGGVVEEGRICSLMCGIVILLCSFYYFVPWGNSVVQSWRDVVISFATTTCSYFDTFISITFALPPAPSPTYTTHPSLAQHRFLKYPL